MTFAEMNIRQETLEALAAMGVLEPTPIQSEATPHLLAGRDVIGQARTGSGKTLAFSIPLVEVCDPDVAVVQALVLVPTRELAFQVGSVIEDLSRKHRLRCAFLYGGRDVADQQTLLASGPQVVIGTPGRLLDLLFRGNLRLNELRFMVIDEADEMFDEGFGPDVDQLLDCILQRPQMALFSATIPKWVESIAQRKLKEAVTVRIDPGKGPIESVEHTVISVPDGQKIAALCELLDDADGSSVVFCRTKDGVERLTAQLSAAGYVVAGLRGNMTQPERERVMRGFRIGKPDILVATNVAARGLDVANIGRVINFDLPDSPELLTHRLGRAGRMGRAGEAMTLVTPRDRKRWVSMQARLGSKLNERRWEPGRSDQKPAGEKKERGSRPAEPAAKRSARVRPSRVPSQNASANGHGYVGNGRTVAENGRHHAGRPPKKMHATSSNGRQSTNGRKSTAWYETVCDGCGTSTRVPYEPTPQRAAYCRECYELVSTAV